MVTRCGSSDHFWGDVKFNELRPLIFSRHRNSSTPSVVLVSCLYGSMALLKLGRRDNIQIELYRGQFNQI